MNMIGIIIQIMIQGLGMNRNRVIGILSMGILFLNSNH